MGNGFNEPNLISNGIKGKGKGGRDKMAQIQLTRRRNGQSVLGERGNVALGMGGHCALWKRVVDGQINF